MIRFSRIAMGALVVMAAGQALADPVTASGYTFDAPTACGSWCYHDPSLSKLTDGVVGQVGWAANAGAEWVGWVYQPQVNIDFSFAQAHQFSSVSVGSTQDYLGDVALPSFDLWAKVGGNWVHEASIVNPPSSANDSNPYAFGPHAFYTFSGLNVSTDQLRVTATANGPWTFVDEVTFQAAPVPEPASYAMLLAGMGLLGAAARRARRK